MSERLFTVEEANRLIPEVRRRLGPVQDVLRRMRDVRDQLTDLRIVWGDKVSSPTCPDRDEYARYQQDFARLEAELRDRLEEIRRLGGEVKDPDAGLVDFQADRAGEVVCLCWKLDEGSIQWWHRAQEGFAGRQPLTEF